MSDPISVQGGAGGITADCEAMLARARALGALSLDGLQRGAQLQRVLVDPDLAAPGVLDPPGAARFGFELAAALDGPNGLLATALRVGVLDFELRSAAIAYQSADTLSQYASPYRDALRKLPQASGRLSTDLQRIGGDLISGHPDRLVRDAADLQSVITADPALASVLIAELAGSPMFVALRRAFVASQLLADGRPVLTQTGPDPEVDAAGPPRSTADLITALARRPGGGNIDVRILGGAGPLGTGSLSAGRRGPNPVGRRVIVDLPGTDNWRVSNGNPDVTNLGTNALAIEGATTTYERGVIEALQAAGVTAADDVLLVGHSQGGLVAVTTARDVMASGEFNVSHVITAGAPIAATVATLPRSVQVLAIENSTDVVPMLDGATNPDRPNITTVTVRHEVSGKVGDNHSLTEAYGPGARDIDAAVGTDPSITAFTRSLGDFMSSRDIRTQTFRITRASK